ncbi:hypothetical protein IIB79_05150 [candidate division KSB1 bacterium]|nr:hypothetical protein [candidate division KSB1 bacterium]
MFEDFLPLLIPLLYWIFRKGFSNKSYNDQLKENLEKRENRKREEIEKSETNMGDEEASEQETPGLFESLFTKQREQR